MATTTKEPTKEIWEQLRKPFPKESIGILPKPYKRDSPKGKCNECGGYHGLPAVHLDYVGHAVTTDRLNSVVGPENWSLDPMATDERGNPLTNAKGELWCWLTIMGARKMCVGDGSTSGKELIGDALRNGCMRFGIALDLWTKDELESQLDAPEAKNEKPSAATATPAVSAAATPAPQFIGPAEAKQLLALAKRMGFETKETATDYLNTVTGLADWTKLPMHRVTTTVRQIDALLPDEDALLNGEALAGPDGLTLDEVPF